MQRQADLHTTFASVPGETLEGASCNAGKRLSPARLILWATGGLAIGLEAQTAVRGGWQQQSPFDQMADARFVAASVASGAPQAGSGAVTVSPEMRRQPNQALPVARASAARSPGLISAPASPAVESPGVPDPAVMDADILVDDMPMSLDQARVVLPTGSRFQVRVRSDQPGTVVIHTVNPAGTVSVMPLWQSDIQAGQTLQSASMRLEGARGRETLQIVLIGQDGQVRGHRQLQFWHM